jgi:hypothetical protein
LKEIYETLAQAQFMNETKSIAIIIMIRKVVAFYICFYLIYLFVLKSGFGEILIFAKKFSWKEKKYFPGKFVFFDLFIWLKGTCDYWAVFVWLTRGL